MDSVALGQVLSEYFACLQSFFHKCFMFIPVIRGVDITPSTGHRSKTLGFTPLQE
jgi:hypothetical protein